MEVRSAAKLGPRVRTKFIGHSRTKQAMRDECDVNLIMARYDKTGLIDHFSRYGAEYGFASSVTFHDAMNVVTKAEQMFGALPAKARKRFNGAPAEFLEFVQNPANAKEMVELGLVDSKRPLVTASDVLEPEVDSPEPKPDEASETPVEAP